DFRDYNDVLPGGDIHVRFHSFSMRNRLDKANGRHDNQVMIVNDNRFGLYNSANPLLQSAVLKLDRWITAIKADARDIPQIEKVVQDKPTACNALYPTNSFPREVAGAGVAADIVKCQLKPLSPADYVAAFTPAPWARLQTIFPSGVCDWSKPGVEQQDLIGTWVFFN